MDRKHDKLSPFLATSREVSKPKIESLPPEIWELIAEKVLKTNREDMMNLSNSSEFFHSILQGKKTSYLFEDILKIVVEVVWGLDGIEGFPISDLLKCREICSQWSASVDKFILANYQLDLDNGRESDVVTSDALKPIVNSFEFSNDVEDATNMKKSVSNFIRHFENTHIGQQQGRDPTIWGRVSVKIAFPVIDEEENDVDDEGTHQFIQDVSKLLQSYGNYLKKFTLKVNTYYFFENAQRLKEWFSRFPNLEELTLTGEALWFDYPEAMGMDEYEEDFEFLKLQHLHTLKVNCFPKKLLKHLVLQNTQITKLDISYWQSDAEFSAVLLPNLTKLALENYATEIFDTLVSEGQWPVKSLKILFDSMEMTEAMAGPLLESIQKKFANTLVDLEIGVVEMLDDWEPEIWEDLRDYRLDLPCLKNITLCMKKFPINLDFLLPMRRSLEKIKVQLSYNFPLDQERATGTSGTITQFIGFENKMLHSNIWAIFKNLDEFHVVVESEDRLVTTVYYRSDWEKDNVYD